MPWGPQEFKAKHNKKLTSTGAKAASKAANAVLAKTGDEGSAVRIGNTVGNRVRKK
jgi:hypothetical protein